MAIKRPAPYEHNNPNNPIVDVNNTSGGLFIMTGSTAEERFNLPLPKLKENQLVKNTVGELWELIDIDERDNSAGWRIFSSSGVTSGCCSEAVLYTNSAATYVTTGGIEEGSTFSAVTMQDMWTDLLYPNLNPMFTTFTMSGYSTSVDVGYILTAGTKTWTWSTANPNFIQDDTVKLLDYTNSTYLVSGLSNGGIEDVATPINIQKTSRLSHRWIVYAQKMNNTWFGRDYYMNWYWRRYWGESTIPDLNETNLTGLTNNDLSNVITGDFVFPADNSYKYIVIPTVSGHVPVAGNPHNYWYGKRPESIKDVSTNLNIALAGPSDGYTHTVNDAVLPTAYATVSNNLPCKLMSIINPYGFPTECYVFRTKYKLGGAITIKVD